MGRCQWKGTNLNLGAVFSWNRLGSSPTSQGQWDVNLALMREWQRGGGNQCLGWVPVPQRC